MNASKIKELSLQSLAANADAALSTISFQRNSKSTEFIRRLASATQALDMSATANPSYAHGAIAHIYPRIKLSMPDVCEKAKDLVDGNLLLLADAPDIMVNRPLEHFVSKAQRVQWYAFHENDFAVIMQEITEVFIKFGLPFFDSYRNATDVVRGYEDGDDRPKLQENWAIFVSAAYLVLGKTDLAFNVLSSSFHSPGARRRYAIVFKNMEHILAAK